MRYQVIKPPLELRPAIFPDSASLNEDDEDNESSSSWLSVIDDLPPPPHISMEPRSRVIYVSL